MVLNYHAHRRGVDRIPKVGVTLHREAEIMQDANSRPDLISRLLKRSKTSFKKWFNSVPNLATVGNKRISDDTNSKGREVFELDHEQRYHDLLVKIQGDQSGMARGRESPKSVQQLQEIVNDIVCERKEKMANAHSKQEILLEFMTGLYKIKSLL